MWDATAEQLNFLLDHSPIYKRPSTQYGHFIPLDLNLDARDWQIIRVGDKPQPVELIIDWGNSITATQLQIIAEGTEGVTVVPA